MADDREALQRRLRDIFVQELEESLRTLTRGLLRLERQEDGEADVGDLFRCAHGLKGAAHAVGVTDAVAICDRMESTFAALRDRELESDAAVIADLLADVDALGAVASSLSGGVRPTTTRPAPGSERDTEQQASSTRTGEQGQRPADPIHAGPVHAGPRSSGAPQSLRVAVGKIDALFSAAGEGIASSQQLSRLSSDAVRVGDLVEAGRQRWRTVRASIDTTGIEAQVRIVDDLLDEAAAHAATVAQSTVMAQREVQQATAAVTDAAQTLRLQPLADAFDGLDRIVRDIAATSGKRAQLSLEAGDAEVDRAVIAALRDPLLHLVRNAVDHGVESPDERAANGKPAVASVTASAEVRDNVVVMVVADDGRGIDVEGLRLAAERRGLPVPSDPLESAFLHGVSTAPAVTAVSGRGVGLDAVRARLEEIGGTIEMATEPGAGTRVTLTVPTTLTTMRVLLSNVAGETVALPVVALERVATIDATDIREVQGRSVITIDGDTRQGVPLAELFGLSSDNRRDDELPVALMRGGGAAFVVDGLIGDVDVVVKPPPRRVDGVAGMLGVAVLAQGEAALVVNPAALLRTTEAPALTYRATVAPPARRRVLLAEDTVTTRALERSILEAAGYDVVTAADGLHAWQLLQSEEVDLVVTDVDMPRMDGLALCEAIRRTPALRNLPVVLVTSLASDRDRQRGVDAGADAYFVKSDFEQGTLLETLQRLL